VPCSLWAIAKAFCFGTKSRCSHVLVVVVERIIELIPLAQWNGALLAFAGLIGP
jgi:hypothetical protein